MYPAGTPRKDFLRWYSRTFNVVEGNGTFYGVPGSDTFRKWTGEAAEGFEFCFKVPRAITHDAKLVGSSREVAEFIDRLRIVDDAGKLGPTLLQLGPDFAGDRFDDLAAFVESWPLSLAVEVRHADWYDAARTERQLDDLLRSTGADRVMFDSRALYQSPPDDDIEVESQNRKPKLPPRTTVTGRRPMVRFIGRNRVRLCEPYLDRWAETVAGWIADGLRPIFFTHAPDDAMAPSLARLWMERLSRRIGGSNLAVPVPPVGERQQRLF